MKLHQLPWTNNYLYHHFIQPRSSDTDSRRRELILNILIVSLLAGAVIALSITLTHHFSRSVYHSTGSLVSTLVATFITALLLWLSRRGFVKAVSYIFVIFLLLLAIELMTSWGFSLPIAQLATALSVVIAGILLGARAGLAMTALAVLFIFIIGSLQLHGQISADWKWLKEPFNTGDAISYSAVIAIIGLVSWLANKEIDNSLRRARRSEHALAKERDNLEIKVQQRTQELERAQIMRLAELQRFAEFGKLSANLLHEVSNPLTAASINLEQLHDVQHSSLILQARQSLQHMERYIEAARKQLKGQAMVSSFSIRTELEQVENILRAVAQKARVKLIIEKSGDYHINGDAVKFNQLMANIILNAIEAYDGISTTGVKRVVTVTTAQTADTIILTVRDYGKGIKPSQQPHLFEPFYSTKPQTSRGMGIGLAMVKQFIEEDFSGSIGVESSRQNGTQFIVKLTSRAS